MKQTTKEWLLAAEDDLMAAEKLRYEERLTNIAAFHCQQCLEKCLKALIEEQNLPSAKSHDLLRLREMAGFTVSEQEFTLLATINEVYIDARYPGDYGLMPHGKPTSSETQEFIQFCKNIFLKMQEILKIA